MSEKNAGASDSELNETVDANGPPQRNLLNLLDDGHQVPRGVVVLLRIVHS